MTDYLANFRGTLTGGTLSEIFTHSIAIKSSASPSAVAQACVAALSGRWPGPAPGMATVFGTGVTYTEVTVASIIDPLLHYGPDPDNPGAEIQVGPKVSVAYHAPFQPPISGADAAGSLPSQNAIAVSYSALAALPNGADAKGRFYLPTPAKSAVDNVSGMLTTNAQQICLDVWAGVFSDLTAGGHQLAVWSRKYGLLYTAQEMRVGNKVDTIRSRRNKGLETYVLGDA